MRERTPQTDPRKADRRPLFVALVLGALAALLVLAYLGGSSNEVVLPSDAITIVVANQTIPAGARITAAMLEMKTLPVVAVSAASFQSREEVVGRTARYPIEKDEPVTASRLVEPAKVRAISFQIPAGMRAMTIPVSINNTPAALLAPGDFVDVIVSIEVTSLVVGAATPTAAGQSRVPKGAFTILQNLQVLSVDRLFVDDGVVYDASVRGQPPGEKQSIGFVTLAVTPSQAQVLWLAQQEGKITLVMRPFGENTIVQLSPFLEPFAIP